MSSKGQKCNVVLMVDMQPDPGNKTMQVNYENRLKCVRSCSLKLLTHFSNKVPEDNFQWGFKFFNSVSSNISDRWGFESFTLRNFELFENRLEEKFETECMKRESLHRSAAKLMTSEYDNTPRSSRLSSAHQKLDDDDRSSQLKTSLKEICHDFSWEVFDPNSPAKAARPKLAKDKRRSGKAETNCLNYLFVFSPCPHSMEDLRKFAECDGTNLQAVLYSFMPDYLRKEICDKRKIRLSWVDVATAKSENNFRKQGDDLEGLKTMNEVLSQTGGSVIVAGALIQTGGLSTSLLAPLIQKYKTEELKQDGNSLGDPEEELDMLSNLPVPTSSVLDNLYSNLQNTSQHDAYLDLPLCHTNPGEKLLERIKVHALHVKHSADSSAEEVVSQPVLHLTLPSEVPGACGDGSTCVTNDAVVLHTGERVPKKFALRLRGHGCIAAKNLPLSAMHSNAAYLVTSKGGSPQKFFEPLIAVLAQHQQVLVVECMDSVNQTPVTGILQPLTAVSATLTLVKTPFWPVLEKLMAFGKPTTTQTHPVHIKKFIEKCAASILGPFNISENCTPMDEDNTSNNCKNKFQNGNMDAFNPAMVEHWYPSSSCKNENFVEELKHRTTIPREKENKDLLKCLRQFYKANKNKSLGEEPADPMSANASLRRSPRKSPRKAYGKSPAKNASKALRKSPRKTTLTRKSSDKVVVMDRNRSFTAPASSRCTAIFQRSKSTLYESPKKYEKCLLSNGRITKKVSSAEISVGDFKDVPDMVQHLLSLYQQTIDMRNSALHCAQTMVNIAHHYMQSQPAKEENNPLEEVDKVFHDFILQSNNQLRDKYMDPQLASCDDLKAAEFELQVLLPLELESLVQTENEELLESRVQQIVTKLRTLAFIKDTSYLNDFLSKSLLDNYVHALPKVLVMIYEELLQPLPPQLEAFGEDDEMMSSIQPPSNASSCNTDPRSALSNDDLSSVRSNRTRRSVGSFPSFNHGTRRQIAIPGKAQTNNKVITRSAKKKAAKKQKKETKAEMRKVRRNLFDPVDSVSTGKKEPKTPQRASQRIAIKDLATTPKEYHILKTRKVEETPKHKQVRQALWRRQRTHTDTDVLVVQESPDKCLNVEKAEGPIRTPGRLIGGAKRKSFYSDAPDKQSRSMIRFKESRSVDASKSTQSRYNLLEARMTGGSPNKVNSSQTQSATSPRRIKPMCLFSHLLSPSPSKPVLTRSTPGSARRRLDISDFDTPSKNTRSHDQVITQQDQAIILQNHSPAVKSLTFTPKKTAQFESLFAGRSLGTGSPGGTRTPVKTPRRITATSIGLLHNSGKTPVKGILKTPKKQVSETPQKHQSGALSVSDLLMSPDRLTRQQARTLMLSTNTPKSQSKRCLDSLLVSSNSVKWEDECEIGSKNFGTDDGVFASPCKSAQTTSENLPTTPSKLGTHTVKVPQTPTHGTCDKLGKENCVTPKGSKKRIKTPDSLDKWPRRKRRNTQNSPPNKVVTSACSPARSDSSGSVNQEDISGTEDKKEDYSDKVLSTPSKNLRTVSSSALHSASGIVLSCTPKKRKRDFAGVRDDTFTTGLLSDSPLKRCKLAALESRMSSSQSSSDYFDTTDVFLSGSEPSQKVTNRVFTRVISGGSDGASVLTSDPPSSPVFPMAAHLLTRQGSSHDQDNWSDQDSQAPSSPVFQRKISSLIETLESDPENSPLKRSVPSSPVVGSPHMNFKKFSPNVSAKSLSHLMMSPLISDKKTNQSTLSPRKSVKRTSPSGKPSRRSLYKSRP